MATFVKLESVGHHGVVGAGGATHSYSEEEKVAFSEHINQCLGSDPVLARHLPLDPSAMDLFEKVGDGLILCKLINLAVNDTIDERAMNIKDVLNVYQKTENCNLALNAAKAIGCQIVNIGAQDIIESRPILILGLVWQIIKIQLTAQISLKNFPELVVLLQQDESLGKFMKLPAEQILLRWINYHLREAGSSRSITNFGNDVTDSEIYSILLNRLNSSCPLANQTDRIQKANQVIKNARIVGVAPFIKAKDICDGNKKLNMSFAAQIFNACPGLVIVTEEAVLAELSDLEIEDSGDSREERVFRMWINSLNLDGVFVHDLYDDMSDGLILLRLLDHLSPGIVAWKKVTTIPEKLSRFKKVENCNMAVNLGKEPVFKFSLVNIGGLDVCDGNKKIILAYVWQLCRKYTLQVLAHLAASEGIAEMTDEKVVTWANTQVSVSDLVHAIEPRAVDFSLVNAGDSDEDNMLNAKYVINCARKVGACIFLTPEDIVECKSKMLLTFVAALWEAALKR